MATELTPQTTNALAIASQTESANQEHEQFLRLLLAPNTAIALSVQYLTEVFTISPEQIVPIPHLSPWVMGVYNWRGEILWMVDLGHLLGLTPWYRHRLHRSTFSAIAVHHHTSDSTQQNPRRTLGLVVDEVDDMEWCHPKDIKPLPPSVITPSMSDFVQGCWWKTDSDMLTVIDGEAIFNAMSKPSHIH